LAEARTTRTAGRHYQPTQQRPTRGGDPALRRHVFRPGQDERRDQPRSTSTSATASPSTTDATLMIPPSLVARADQVIE
jgi:hypothetical protein